MIRWVLVQSRSRFRNLLDMFSGHSQWWFEFTTSQSQRGFRNQTYCVYSNVLWQLEKSNVMNWCIKQELKPWVELDLGSTSDDFVLSVQWTTITRKIFWSLSCTDSLREQSLELSFLPLTDDLVMLISFFLIMFFLRKIIACRSLLGELIWIRSDVLSMQKMPLHNAVLYQRKQSFWHLTNDYSNAGLHLDRCYR